MNALKNQSLDIKRKTLDLLKNLVSQRNISIVFPILLKELKRISHSTDEDEVDFKNMILLNFKHYALTFPSVSEEIVNSICETLITFNQIDDNSAKKIISIFKHLLETNIDLREKLLEILTSKLCEIHSEFLIKSILWILGVYSHDIFIEKTIHQLKKFIGSLPIEEKKKNLTEEEEELKKKQKKPRIKTIILPDFTYGTQIIDESNDGSKYFKFLK